MGAHASYFVCATPRSGSSLLCEGLRKTRLAGHPAEYFSKGMHLIWSKRWNCASHAEYRQRVLEHCTTANGVFGIKMMWDHMVALICQLRKSSPRPSPKRPPAHLVAEVFPRLRYIWITRSDKVRQAVSFDLAVQTGVYEWKGHERPAQSREPTFNFDRIDFLRHRIMAADDAWQQYFVEADVIPLKVIYEELIDRYHQTIGSILDYLDIPAPKNYTFEGPRLKKMADSLNEDWVRRYHQMKKQQTEAGSRTHRRLAEWLT